MEGGESKRGVLIVIEGCDRSGKSTQAALLSEWFSLMGLPSQMIKFPNRQSRTGKIIDDYLRHKNHLSDESVHLLFSANRWEEASRIKDTLLKGHHIIIDRYAYSGLAYSHSKGLDMEWCKAPDKGLPDPDLVLFLDLPIEVASQRFGYGEERYEEVDFQTKVRSVFLSIREDSWRVLNANQSPDRLALEVRLAAQQTTKSLNTAAIGNLWM